MIERTGRVFFPATPKRSEPKQVHHTAARPPASMATIALAWFMSSV